MQWEITCSQDDHGTGVSPRTDAVTAVPKHYMTRVQLLSTRVGLSTIMRHPM